MSAAPQSEFELLYNIFGGEDPYPVYGKIQKSGQTWGWCGHCEGAYVECPKCGNNCCNGGYGQLMPDGSRVEWFGENKYIGDEKDLTKCDKCPSCYDAQDKAAADGTEPQIEEFKIVKIWNKEKEKYEEV